MIKDLNEKIIWWAEKRRIDKDGDLKEQSIKSAEEFSELVIGISKHKKDLIEDSIGDVYVTLVVGNLIDRKLDILKLYKEVKKDYQGLRADFWMHGAERRISYISDCIKLILRQGYTEHIIKTSIKCLISLAEVYELPFEKCVETAYEEIADRKGRMVNGLFVKESDLID